MSARLTAAELDARVANRDDAVRNCLARAHVLAQAERFSEPIESLPEYDVEREHAWWVAPLYSAAIVAGAFGPFFIDWITS